MGEIQKDAKFAYLETKFLIKSIHSRVWASSTFILIFVAFRNGRRVYKSLLLVLLDDLFRLPTIIFLDGRLVIKLGKFEANVAVIHNIYQI